MAEQIGKNRAEFSWAELQRVLTYSEDELDTHSPNPAIHIVGVTTDTRMVEPGNLFIALRGEKFDGHNYLQQAKDEGAIVAVVDHQCDVDIRQIVVPNTLEALGTLARYYHLNLISERVSEYVSNFEPTQHWRLDRIVPRIAVTGSYGKTSTRALIVAALRTRFKTLASEGNFNNEIGVPLTLLQMETDHEAIVIEMGMRGRGQIAELAGLFHPTIGVITNIGPQHIELLGSEENIALAKAELLEWLVTPDLVSSGGLAVLPADSSWLDLLKSKIDVMGRFVMFGTDPKADYRVDWTQTDAEGNVLFDLSFPIDIYPYSISERKTLSIQLPLPGAHNAVNAAAAFAVAHQLGVTPENIVQGLENAELPGARMRIVKLADGTTLIDDCYNAGPNSMRAALQTLLDYPGAGRRVAILGAMRELGDHSEAQHAAIGRFAGIVCDVLVGVDGETRPLLNAAVAAAREVENELQVSLYENAAEAAARVREWTQAGDVVLIKGSRSIGLETVVEALGRGL